MTQTQPKSGRKDHYLPESYLRGFIFPSREPSNRLLWVYYPEKRRWKEMTPASIGYGHGFYDPIGDPTDLVPADDVFSRLENDFHRVRGELIMENFRNFQDHLEFLLQYVNMLRARSPLFFTQVMGAHRLDRLATVLAVNEEGRRITLDSLEGKPAPDTWVRNRTLQEMREEIEKGSQADWARELNWCVRTATESLPVITAQHALIYLGPNGTKPDARDVIFYFPICWQACLIGAKFKWHTKVDEFDSGWLGKLHQIYFANEKEFIVSPRKLGHR
jgi:hypothetical protein